MDRSVWQRGEMATWMVLLRGVNVGGANRLAMADLRALMTKLGHAAVATYIQSGNAVVTSPRKDRAALAAEICAGIEDAHGLSVSAILRTPNELRAALARYPFTGADGSQMIAFLADQPTAADAAKLEPQRFFPDRFELHGSDLHLLYPNGSGRSKMTLDYFEKCLRLKGTSRNLNTVAKLIDLADR